MAGATVINKGKAKITITGLSEYYKRLNEISPKAKEAGKAILNRAAERIYRNSQQLVPVDTGALKRSAKIIRASTRKDSDKVTAAVQYGMAGAFRDVFYAVVVHEDLSAKHPNGGEAKFLEKPAVAEQANITNELAAAIKAALDE